MAEASRRVCRSAITSWCLIDVSDFEVIQLESASIKCDATFVENAVKGRRDNVNHWRISLERSCVTPVLAQSRNGASPDDSEADVNPTCSSPWTS